MRRHLPSRMAAAAKRLFLLLSMKSIRWTNSRIAICDSEIALELSSRRALFSGTLKFIMAETGKLAPVAVDVEYCGSCEQGSVWLANVSDNVLVQAPEAITLGTGTSTRFDSILHDETLACDSAACSQMIVGSVAGARVTGRVGRRSSFEVCIVAGE